MLKCNFCSKEISEHEAGRCLDVWLHRLKEGRNFVYLKPYQTGRLPQGSVGYIKLSDGSEGRSVFEKEIPRYSTDLNHAWNLLDNTLGLINFSISCDAETDEPLAIITTERGQSVGVDKFNPALAICRAFIMSANEKK